jgi:hypothetical protein
MLGIHAREGITYVKTRILFHGSRSLQIPARTHEIFLPRVGAMRFAMLDFIETRDFIFRFDRTPDPYVLTSDRAGSNLPA